MNDRAKFTYASVTNLIDLDRYPIEDLGGQAAQTLIAECQAHLAEQGACSLPGFIKPEAVATMAAEVLPPLSQAFYNQQQHNVYFKADDTALPEDHPARRQVRTSQWTIAYDLLPLEAGIRQVYTWPPVREFIAAVLGRERLYLHADPLAAMNVMVMNDGDELGWHYDRADFVTTLLLQRPDAGGAFEFVPHLRSPDDENFAGLEQLLDGTHPDVVSRAGQAGTLTLFVGHYSPHRVSPVQGETPRMVAVLSYENEPDTIFSEASRIRFYGRAG